MKIVSEIEVIDWWTLSHCDGRNQTFGITASKLDIESDSLILVLIDQL